MTEVLKNELQISDQTFDEERALYHLHAPHVLRCRFDGPTDGESALKECTDVRAEQCFFNLRYPFWHCKGVTLSDSEMTDLCRAALWYCENVRMTDNRINGVKALRECKGVSIDRCSITSTEFGWSVCDLELNSSTVEGEYLFLRAEDLCMTELTLKGKYSFQYIKNATLTDCHLQTKDAFWHAENVTLRNCTLQGEYLAWYSKNLTLINCRIIGTQPFCYCEGLRLIDCEMLEADFCFERSEVDATLTTPVISIRRPRTGIVRLPSVGEILEDDEEAKGEILVSFQAKKEP